MKVILAETLGFCRGVETAVDLIYKEIEDIGGEKVFMEGPVIHNRILVEDLESKGVKLLDENININGASVVVRAHGITPELEHGILLRGGKIVDGTCAIVKSSQKKIKKYVDEGFNIIISGDKGHPEVVGLLGQAPKKIQIVSSVDDVNKLKIYEKTILMSQTTFSKNEFYKIEEAIKKICPTLKSLCTICGATKKRQEAVRKLGPLVDVIIVIGGLKSSNTIRLQRVAEEFGPSWLVESYKDIPEEINKYNTVGIAAGASTPKKLIDEVVEYLESI